MKRLSGQQTFGKGDLVKRREPGGHVMTVVEILNGGAQVIASYSTSDGQKHEEPWATGKLKRVDI